VHRLRGILVALFAAPWVLWALVRTLVLDGGHPLVAMISFTPYAEATSILPVVVALVMRRWIVAALATVAMVLLALALVPRAVDGPQRAGDDARGHELVVMTANMLFGRGDARDVVALVRAHDVDVLSLQARPRRCSASTPPALGGCCPPASCAREHAPRAPG